MRKLKIGMGGGGSDAFIGAVHRSATIMDGEVEFLCGALSSTPEKAEASGRALDLAEERTYGSWEEMLKRELSLPDNYRVDFVSIFTPEPHSLPRGARLRRSRLNVVCGKPMVLNSEEDEDLICVVEKSGVVFALTYQYTGYPMVRQARHMIRNGEIRKVLSSTTRTGSRARSRRKAPSRRSDAPTPPAPV